jgi:hypothetical protein
MSVLGLLLSLAWSPAAIAAQAGASPFQALLHDGRVVSGAPAALSTQRLVLDGDSRVDLPIANVIKLTAADRRESPPAPGSALVLLVNGDRLLLDPASLRVSDVELTGRWTRFPAWPPLDVPLETIRGVVLDLPEHAEAADRLIAAIDEHRENRDALVLANGDRIAGEFRGLDAMSVQLAGALATIPRSNVHAVAFNPELFRLPAPDGIHALVSLIDGSRITAAGWQLDGQGQVRLQAAFGGSLELPLARVAAIRVLGGRAEWLGQREPADSRFQPYLSTTWPIRRNRSVTGGPLRLDGAECPLGLGMHTRTEAVYDLGGRYRWFHAAIGVDDTAGERGSVVFAVEVDGTRVFTSTVLRASDAAVQILPIDLGARQRLTLIVDYGPWGDVQDYANWCDAVLVK